MRRIEVIKDLSQIFYILHFKKESINKRRQLLPANYSYDPRLHLQPLNGLSC